jgi:hypothetical protein
VPRKALFAENWLKETDCDLDIDHVETIALCNVDAIASPLAKMLANSSSVVAQNTTNLAHGLSGNELHGALPPAASTRLGE